ncbi:MULTISPECIES: Bro-N domain-containing protein [Thiomonas]|uniref:Putative Prophage antirepressor n=1 Tax=Thiomonas delicata TaxID=364030 RepID=A0A238D6Y9_THIDL|nr:MULTISPECIES: BRO family protein [Thiomonas]CQR42445.1 putative Prophage antirepressor [Thiomonas sp. CB3]CDW96285.1 putative Prophage antirepressor [Thiomonas sp. CB2]CQR44343.1 putative Prophage antirepressor [Thiomonas sp. CB3]CQR44632.1 putative Prophage antirepressor [Thiomonas sp. CB3]SBP89076.1 putative Prophage antirepressor [Thiomonas delicata]
MATAAETKPIIRLDFEGNPILVQMGEDGSVWYTAKPLCTALGFKKMAEAIERHVKLGDQQSRGVPTGGGVQQMMHVNEAGMQALVAASHRVATRRFKKWIAAGVIHAAVRAMEAQDGEVLGDRLDGMTEFKPIAKTIAAKECRPVDTGRQASCQAPHGQGAQIQPAADQQEPAMSTHDSTSGQIIHFAFGGKTVRAVHDESGEPCFVGKDVCDALGYADHINAIKQHCRGVVKRHPIIDSLGRTQEVRVLSEPDVMRLIVSSKLPAAEAFERLVFEEILPTIRKTGRYSAEKEAPPALGPIQAPGTQEKLQGAMDVARALIGIGEATLGREGLKAQIPNLSHPEVALGLAGLVLKNKRFLLTLDDLEHPVIRPLEKNEMIIQASGSEWIDKLLSVMNQDQLKAMARFAMARIV